MTAAALLPRLRAAGAEVALRGDKLVLVHADRVPTELMAEARARRADLLDEMANDNAAPGDRPFADDPVERAAIQAEAMPVKRIRKRQHCTSNAADIPQPGDYCGCCTGHSWWTAAPVADGWACWQCHVPDHLEPGKFGVVAT